MTLQDLSASDLGVLSAAAALLAAIVAAAASITSAVISGWFERRNQIAVEMRQHARTALIELHSDSEKEIKALVEYAIPDVPLLRLTDTAPFGGEQPVKPLTISWSKRLEEALAHRRDCRKRTKDLFNLMAPDLPLEDTDHQKQILVMTYAQVCWNFLFELERFYFQKPDYWFVMKFVRMFRRWQVEKRFKKCELQITTANELQKALKEQAIRRALIPKDQA